MGKKTRKRVEDTSETQYIKTAKDRFFEIFSQETEDVREAIVRDLPAYHALLNMEATSFEEMVLLQLCEEKGLPAHLATTLVPNCPYCGSDAHVGRKEAGIFRCHACSKKTEGSNEITFAPNFNAITAGTKLEALTWMQLVLCMLSYTPMSKTIKLCDITETTYFRMRSKIFYAMRLLLDGLEDGSGEYGVKLCGHIQVDNTFIRASFKGMQLYYESDINDFEEDSIFFDDSLPPRGAKKRGRPNKMSERGANTIAIFTAIDDRGRVMARYAGTGATSLRLLKQYVPESKILKEVPKSIPFEKIAKKRTAKVTTKPGDKTLIIADKEPALENYADYLGTAFESHVYRKNGVQWKMAPGHHDIQRVNALHARLKNHLRRCGYVSTKYLPGILTLFEFMENFDQEKAIKELFKVLSMPGLGKTPSFYQSLFTVPNYLEEWFESNGVLRRLPYNKLLAFYLYDHMRHKEDYPNLDGITMDYIERATGYVRTTIRRSYAELDKAGYRQKILSYFGEPPQVKKSGEIIIPKPQKQKKPTPHYTYNYPPIIFALYDDYIDNYRGVPKQLRKYRNSQDWCIDANERFGTDFSYHNLMKKFSYIREGGRRPELPKFDKKAQHSEYLTRKQAAILLDYEALEKSYRQRGEKPPLVLNMQLSIGTKYSLSPAVIKRYLSAARAYRLSHPKEFELLLEEIKKERAAEENSS